MGGPPLPTPPVASPPPPQAGATCGYAIRCAGCKHVLIVPSGLTEFLCPGPTCQLPQILPPELLPTNEVRIEETSENTARDIDRTRNQLICNNCNALLNVPRHLSRYNCPALDVDLSETDLDSTSVGSPTPSEVNAKTLEAVKRMREFMGQLDKKCKKLEILNTLLKQENEQLNQSELKANNTAAEALANASELRVQLDLERKKSAKLSNKLNLVSECSKAQAKIRSLIEIVEWKKTSSEQEENTPIDRSALEPEGRNAIPLANEDPTVEKSPLNRSSFEPGGKNGIPFSNEDPAVALIIAQVDELRKLVLIVGFVLLFFWLLLCIAFNGLIL